MCREINMKDEIIRYLDAYNKNIRKHSGSYRLKEINENLFPELKAFNQGEKIFFDTQKGQVSLLSFLMDTNNINYMTIFLFGEGGMGKTVSMISSTEVLSELQGENYFPIYIPLYEINDIEDDGKELLEKYMFEEIWQGDKDVYDYFSKPNNIKESVIFFLDGFNELGTEIRNKIAKEIKHLINRNRGKIIVSSRDEGLLDFPSFYKYEDEIVQLKIEALKEDQIRNYLKTCGMDYPEDNNRLKDVLSNPLMLALYANYKEYNKRDQGTPRYLSWYFSPVNAGQIIWNFLQAQVIKLWLNNDEIIWAINSYISVNFVSAYIGYKMEVNQKYSVTISLIKVWIQELHEESEILSNIFNDLCVRGLEQEFTKGNAIDWKLNGDEIEKRLCLFINFFEEPTYTEENVMFNPEECKVKFMHQQFRDCYAAIYRKKVLAKKSWYLDDAWSKTISPAVLRFCADLFSKKDLTSLIENVRGIEFEKRNVVLTNILNICKIVYGNDFTNFDFSNLDLRHVYLGGIKMSSDTKFENTKVSHSTFLPEGHEGKVNAISVLKSGKFSISGGEDQCLIMWDIVTGKREKKFAKKYGNITGIDSCLREDEEGQESDFVLVGNKQGKVVEINIHKNIDKCLLDVKCEVTGVFYNPINAKEFAVITRAGELLIYNITLQKICHRIISSGKICCGSYSPDATKFVLGLENGAIEGWIVEKEIPFINYKRHNVAISAIAYSSSGKYVVSGSNEGKLIICEICLNTKNQRYEEVLKKEKKCDKNIQCIKFYPCSTKENVDSFIWSTNGTESAQNLIMQYNIYDDSNQILSHHKHLIHDIDFTPDGEKYITASYDTTVKCWDIDTGLCVGTMQGFNSWIRSIAFSPDGQKCVLGSYDNSLKIWDVEKERCCKTLLGHEHWVRDIEFLNSGEKFISVSYDQTLRIWEGKEPYQCQNVFKRHTKGISGVSCSKNGEYCVTASYDGNVILWNFNEQNVDKNYKNLKGHYGRVRDVAYSPNANICVSASYDNTLIVWNCSWQFEGNRIIKVLYDHNDYVRCVTFTSQGNYCISGSYDKTFIVWDTEKWIKKYQSERFPDWIRCLECSPDGKTLLVGCDNGIIYVWNIENNIKIGELRGHNNWIGKIKYFPNGKNCISCSDDNTFKIWKIDIDKNQHKCINTYKILPYLDLVDCDFRNIIMESDSIEEGFKTILYGNGALIKIRE